LLTALSGQESSTNIPATLPGIKLRYFPGFSPIHFHARAVHIESFWEYRSVPRFSIWQLLSGLLSKEAATPPYASSFAVYTRLIPEVDDWKMKCPEEILEAVPIRKTPTAVPASMLNMRSHTCVFFSRYFAITSNADVMRNNIASGLMELAMAKRKPPVIDQLHLRHNDNCIPSKLRKRKGSSVAMGTTHHQVEYRSEYSAMEIHAVLCEKKVSAILKTHVMIPKFSNMLNTGLYASVPKIRS
jgi:hypothetical protein